MQLQLLEQKHLKQIIETLIIEIALRQLPIQMMIDTAATITTVPAQTTNTVAIHRE
jgi:hypothetical protein